MIKTLLLFLQKKSERKILKTAKCYQIVRKSVFILISRAQVMTSSVLKNWHDIISIDELFIFILFDKLQDYDEVYLQVNFESHSCCKQCFRDGYCNYSLPNILWYLKTPVCIELRFFKQSLVESLPLVPFNFFVIWFFFHEHSWFTG